MTFNANYVTSADNIQIFPLLPHIESRYLFASISMFIMLFTHLTWQEESVAALELEYEIQGKITSAALRLANETSARNGVRKQRKMSYQQSAKKLKDLEAKLKAARSKQAATAASMPKQKKKPRPISDSEGGCLLVSPVSS